VPDASAWNESELLVGVIHHPRLVLVRGEGSYVWDVEGRRYLDFTAGLAVAALGHGRGDLADVLREQFATLGHCSNLYGNLPALELARRLKESSFAARIWYANSGTEANEAALKFARLHARAAGGPRKREVVAFKGGFHGRTYGALSATHHPAYRTPFAPLVPGFRFATFNDLGSVERLLSERTAAVIVEPVQGEGGVVPATPEFLAGLRALCDRHRAVLVFDEVQCGLGRLGTLHAYESYGVVPDVVTLAKPIAAGLPLGAVLVGASVAEHLKPGLHGATFSGGPAACAVGVRVFDTISRPEFLARVASQAARLRAGLEAIAGRSNLVREARGRGLMQALVLAPAWRKSVPDVVRAARDRGVLVTRAGDDAVRFLPPLNCSEAEIDAAVAVLGEALGAVAAAKPPARATAQVAPSAGAGARSPQGARRTAAPQDGDGGREAVAIRGGPQEQ
jgi:predicted acetylornithine/succinylornithine family transaminase